MSFQSVSRASELSDLIEARLGVRGRNLKQQLNRARRTMPRWVQREAQQLVNAEALSAHPKLMMQVNQARLDQAYAACRRWLMSVNKAELRKAAALRFVAGNALNLLIVAGLFLLTVKVAGLA